MASAERKLYSGEDYNTVFNPQRYIKEVYGTGSLEHYNGLWKKLIKIIFQYFKHGSFTGPRFLEFGCGPTIHLMATASCYFNDITAAEFAANNRREIEKWINNEPDAWDWSGYINYVCELNDNKETCEERTEKIRQSIKDVIPCDVFKSNPLEPREEDPYDVIVTSLCLEAACMDREQYKMAVKNVASLLKSGGALVAFLILGQTYYDVDGKYYHSLLLDKPFVVKCLEEAGFVDIETVQDLPLHELQVDGRVISDCEGWMLVTAKKK